MGHVAEPVTVADVPRGIFTFPNPVNEVAARTVAAGVLIVAVTTILLATLASTAWLWLTVPLALGFLARVLSGPRFSPLGQFATRVAAPVIGHARLVPGPPKRFAQGMGAALSVTAVGLHAVSLDLGAVVVVCLIACAATLESVFAFCIGCKIFGTLMRLGLIPEQTCAACADLSFRPAMDPSVA